MRWKKISNLKGDKEVSSSLFETIENNTSRISINQKLGSLYHDALSNVYKVEFEVLSQNCYQLNI